MTKYLDIAKVYTIQDLAKYNNNDLKYIQKVLQYLASIHVDWKINEGSFIQYMADNGYHNETGFIHEFGKTVVGVIGKDKNISERTAMRLDRIDQLQNLVNQAMQSSFVLCDHVKLEKIKDAKSTVDLQIYSEEELQLLLHIMEYLESIKSNWKINESEFNSYLSRFNIMIDPECKFISKFGKSVVGSIGKELKFVERTKARLSRIKEIKIGLTKMLNYINHHKELEKKEVENVAEQDCELPEVLVLKKTKKSKIQVNSTDNASMKLKRYIQKLYRDMWKINVDMSIQENIVFENFIWNFMEMYFLNANGQNHEKCLIDTIGQEFYSQMVPLLNENNRSKNIPQSILVNIYAYVVENKDKFSTTSMEELIITVSSAIEFILQTIVILSGELIRKKVNISEAVSYVVANNPQLKKILHKTE